MGGCSESSSAVLGDGLYSRFSLPVSSASAFRSALVSRAPVHGRQIPAKANNGRSAPRANQCNTSQTARACNPLAAVLVERASAPLSGAALVAI
jgi:hypothetical protein